MAEEAEPPGTGRHRGGRGAAGQHRPAAAADAPGPARRGAQPAGDVGPGPAGPHRPGHLQHAGQAGPDQPAVDGRDAGRAGSPRAGTAASRPRGRPAGRALADRGRAAGAAGQAQRPGRPAGAGPVERLHARGAPASSRRPPRCSSDWRRPSDGPAADGQPRRPLPLGGPGQHDRGHVHGHTRRIHRHHRAAGHLPRHPPGPAGARQHQLPAVDDHGVPAGPGRARGQPRPPRRHVRPGQDLQRGLRGVHRGLDPALVRSLPGGPRRAVADRLAGAPGHRRVHAHGQLGRDPDRRVPGRAAGLRAGHQPGGRPGRPVRRPGRRGPAGRDRLARGVLGQRAGRRVRDAVGLPQAPGQRRPQPRPDRLVGQRHLRRRPGRRPDRHHRGHPAVRARQHGLGESRRSSGC